MVPRSVHGWSFGAKLAGVIMLASSIVVVFAASALIVLSIVSGRQRKVEELKTLADVTGENCAAALAFDIPEDAASMLSSLDAQPSIVLAVLYDEGGKVFSTYRNSERRAPDKPPRAMRMGHAYSDGRLTVHRPVMLRGRLLGTLCLVDDLSSVRAAMMQETALMAALAAASLGLAYLLARGLQRLVSGPILALTDVARHVTEERDYSVRVKGEQEDEVGVLVATFNEMLAGIQDRDSALRTSNRKLAEEIHERREAQAELRQLNRTLEDRVRRRTLELQRSNEELERFAYVASHDLQEPLRTIGNFARLIERRYKGRLDQDADEFIQFLTDGAARAQTLINDLLQFSRVGTHGKEFEDVDCGELVDQVWRSMSAAARESGAEISTSDLPTVRGDRGQLTQLFQNLIGNAIKFCKPGERPRIRVVAERQEGGTLFRVEDNGIGIDSKYFERIFVLFRRLEGNKYSGTGIGLAICKKIVQRHGGEIWVESSPGEGTTFRFTIPDPQTRPTQQSQPEQ